MANKVDELIIQIKADTRQLKKELDNIQGKIKTTGAAGGAAFGAMGGASGALAGSLKKLAGPAAIGAVAIGIGKLGGFAARAGMEFEDLKDSLDTVFGSVEAGDKQFKRILDFAQTTPFQIDTVTKAFISLGSVGIEPTSRMMQVFADTASVAVDQRGAFEALIRVVQRAEAGALGLQELNMLADRGIDVFKGLKDELGLSRLELADFGQTADGAKIIVESLTNVLERQFGGAMVSKMDNLSTSVSNMQIAFKNLGNEIFLGPLGAGLKSMVNQTTSIINNLAIAMAEMRGSGLGITLEAPKFKSDMSFDQMQSERGRTAIANIEAINNKIKEMTSISEGDRGVIGNALASFINTPSVGMAENAFKTVIGLLTDLDITSESASSVVANLTNELLNQRDAFNQSTKTEKQFNDEQLKSLLLQGKMASIMGLVQKHQEGIIGNTELLKFGQESVNEIFEKYKLLLDEIGIDSAPKLTKVLQDMQNATSDVAQTFGEALAPAIQSISLSFTNQFVTALLDGQNALQSFKDFAKNIVSQIIATFLQMAVVNKILNSIFGAGSFDTFSFGKGITKASAGGGSAYGGQPMIVGERGPEIFVPHSSGNIMNNMNSKNAMGGGTPINIYQNVNFATGVVSTVRAEVTKMMPQIADVTKAAVQESAMRGGNFRRSLVGG